MSKTIGLDKRSVLVVDDNLDALEVTAEVIEDAFGYTVLKASSSREALALIDQGIEVDLLFSDVVMPETDGVTLANVAKARLPNLHVVLMTGWQSAIDSILARGYVALLKPFSLEQLQAVFSEWSESRVHKNAHAPEDAWLGSGNSCRAEALPSASERLQRSRPACRAA